MPHAKYLKKEIQIVRGILTEDTRKAVVSPFVMRTSLTREAALQMSAITIIFPRTMVVITYIHECTYSGRLQRKTAKREIIFIKVRTTMLLLQVKKKDPEKEERKHFEKSLSGIDTHSQSAL